MINRVSLTRSMLRTYKLTLTSSVNIKNDYLPNLTIRMIQGSTCYNQSMIHQLGPIRAELAIFIFRSMIHHLGMLTYDSSI
jgi:hypothetical protein